METEETKTCRIEKDLMKKFDDGSNMAYVNGNSAKIKAVIFDWGGVLIIDPSTKIAGLVAKKIGIKKDDAVSAWKKIQERTQRGELYGARFWKAFFAQLNMKVPEFSLSEKYFFAQTYVEKKRMTALVKKLRSRGYKTAILSNTEKAPVAYFWEIGWGKYFDAEVFSCLEGTVKPERKIYVTALKRLKVKPEEAVYIDDRKDYAEAAKRIGIKGIVFKSAEQVKEELKKFGVNI